jgi:iron complex outermembrane recepter protein
MVRSHFLNPNLFLSVLIAGCSITQVAWANDKQQDSQQDSVATKMQAELVGDLPEVHTTIQPLLAQETSSVKITGVKVNPTVSGVEITLEASEGKISPPVTKREGNTLTADIPNAVLNLPEGKEFQAANPAKGITNVTVTQNANTVRVSVTGANAVPTVNFVPSASGLMLDLTASSESEEDEIEVVVTGEQRPSYRVPNATTATKTDTPLRDIPSSIQVIPRQVIQDQGATSVRETVRNVSGITLSNTSGNRNETFIIRGFTAAEFQNGFRSDFFSSRTQTELANVERIEVLKGPASVLFGQAEPSGIINFVTKKPLLEPLYELSFTAGSYSFYRPTLDFSGPLTDDKSVAYRLNIAYENAGSFRDRVNTERIFIAPSLSWQISPETKLSFEVTHLRDERPVDRGLVALSNNRVADIPIGRYLGDPTIKEQFTESRATLYLDHRFNPNLALRTALRYTAATEAGPGCTVEVFGASTDDRNFPIGECRGAQYYETWGWQNDLTAKFETGSLKHTLLIGTEFVRQYNFYLGQFRDATSPLDIFNPNYNFTFGEFAAPSTGTSQITSFGIYIQDQIELFDNLKIVLGGRFDTYRDDTVFDGSPFDAQAEAFSPRVGIVYQPIKEVSLYASYSNSFTPVAGRSANNELFKPQRGTAYEAGIKTELFDGRLSSTLAFYQTDLRNVLSSDPDNPVFSVQVGAQRSQGIEFDIAGEILPGWNIIASYGYTDAKITQDNVFPVGNRLNNVPLHTASLWTTYTLQEGDLKGLGFGAGLFYVGDRQGDLDNSFEIPGYTRLDAAIFYKAERFKIALNFKNLTNIPYFEGVQNRTVVQPGAPFTILGTISYQF